jgi:hypothetical protein
VKAKGELHHSYGILYSSTGLSGVAGDRPSREVYPIDLKMAPTDVGTEGNQP